MEFELNEDGTPKLDAEGNPIPKTSLPPAQEPTSQVKEPPAGNIAPEALAVIQEQQRTIREMQERMDREDQKRNQPPEPTADDLNKLYYDNPAAFFDKMISDKIKAQTEPLNNFVSQQRKETEIQTVVSTVESLPDYADDLKNPAFKSAFVNALRQVPNQLDQNIVMIVLNNVTALAYKGKLPGFKQEVQTPTTMPKETPPYIPPTANPVIPAKNTSKVELTEQERKLARIYKMTDEQYAELRDSDSRSFMATGGTK